MLVTLSGYIGATNHEHLHQVASIHEFIWCSLELMSFAKHIYNRESVFYDAALEQGMRLLDVKDDHAGQREAVFHSFRRKVDEPFTPIVHPDRVLADREFRKTPNTGEALDTFVASASIYFQLVILDKYGISTKIYQGDVGTESRSSGSLRVVSSCQGGNKCVVQAPSKSRFVTQPGVEKSQ